MMSLNVFIISVLLFHAFLLVESSSTIKSQFARDLVRFVIRRPDHLQPVYQYALSKFTEARRAFYPKFRVTNPSLTLCADTAYLLYFMGTTDPKELDRGGDSVFLDRGMKRVQSMHKQWREYRPKRIRKTQLENLTRLLCTLKLAGVGSRSRRCFRHRHLMRLPNVMALVSVVSFNKSHAFVIQRSNYTNEYYLWQSHFDKYTLEDHIRYDQFRFTASELSEWIQRMFQCRLVDCNNSEYLDWGMLGEGTLRHQIRLTVDVGQLYEQNARLLDTFYRRGLAISMNE